MRRAHDTVSSTRLPNGRPGLRQHDSAHRVFPARRAVREARRTMPPQSTATQQQQSEFKHDQHKQQQQQQH